jgi:hypothetical protein
VACLVVIVHVELEWFGCAGPGEHVEGGEEDGGQKVQSFDTWTGRARGLSDVPPQVRPLSVYHCRSYIILFTGDHMRLIHTKEVHLSPWIMGWFVRVRPLCMGMFLLISYKAVRPLYSRSTLFQWLSCLILTHSICV